jgi:hypothetical protein
MKKETSCGASLARDCCLLSLRDEGREDNKSGQGGIYISAVCLSQPMMQRKGTLIIDHARVHSPG